MAVFAGILAAPPAKATTIHVPADRPTIQAGIDAAADGDTILVAPGTYYESIDFLGKAITVASSDGPGVTRIVVGSRAGVTCDDGEDEFSVLTGFAISSLDRGIVIVGASPTIAGNAIVSSGGGPGEHSYPIGIFVDGGSPLLTGNLIDGWDEGVHLYRSSSEVVGNVVSNNFNAGLFAYDSTSLITNNAFLLNLEGAMNLQGSAVSVIQNRVSGFAMIWDATPPRSIIANTFVPTSSQAGGIYGQVFTAPLAIENNVVLSDQWPAIDCASYDTVNPPIFRSNDVYASHANAWGARCVDQTGFGENISADPLLVDALSWDVHLTGPSPAIDAGFNAAPGLPASDVDGDPRILDGTVDIGVDEYKVDRALSLSPGVLAFGDQPVGGTSPPQSVTLHNSGASVVPIRIIGAGLFFPTTDGCGPSLGPGERCKIDVSFRPWYESLAEGVLSVSTGAAEAPLIASLSGTGTQPSLVVQLPSFSMLPIGQEQQVTTQVSNVGGQDIFIDGIQIMAGTDFDISSSDCPTSPTPLVPQASCNVTWAFHPTAAGSRHDTVTVTDNEPGGPRVSSLYGYGFSNGAVALSIGSSVLDFGDQVVGTVSTAKTVVVTNAGKGPLGLGPIGTDSNLPFSPTDFSQTNDCPTPLGVGEQCSIRLTFSPTVAGNRGGALYLLNDSPGGAVRRDLSGHGLVGTPTLTAVVPMNLPIGSPDTTLDIYGSGFVYGAVARWNGVTLSPHLIGDTHLQVTVAGALLQSVGEVSIDVVNPAPGGTSTPFSLAVYRPSGYAHSSASYSYRTITGTNLLLGGGYFQLADDRALRVETPFRIQFGGGVFTSLFPSANGTIAFGAGASSSNATGLPATVAPLLVAPLWMDLYPPGTGTDHDVFTQVLGDAPTREFVVEWRNVYPCCTADPTATVRFQVVFFEGRNDVLFNYADVTFGGAYVGLDAGAAATVGIQVGPSQATQFSRNAPLLTDGVSILWTLAPDGDANGDGTVDVRDVFFFLNALFAGGPLPVGLPDVNGDGVVDVRDAFYLINYLFAGGPRPL